MLKYHNDDTGTMVTSPIPSKSTSALREASISNEVYSTGKVAGLAGDSKDSLYRALYTLEHEFQSLKEYCQQ